MNSDYQTKINHSRPFVPASCLLACGQQGLALTKYLLAVHIRRQVLCLFQKMPGAGLPVNRGHYQFRRQYRISTSRFGIGQVAGSHQTPFGLLRIAAKIGGGCLLGAVFESRRVVGFTWQGIPAAPIAHRILWLEGLEPGFNRGGNTDTYQRFIYIHGVGNESTLGRPASKGCIHLAAADLLPLYDRVPAGTLVWIGQ